MNIRLHGLFRFVQSSFDMLFKMWTLNSSLKSFSCNFTVNTLISHSTPLSMSVWYLPAHRCQSSSPPWEEDRYRITCPVQFSLLDTFCDSKIYTWRPWHEQCLSLTVLLQVSAIDSLLTDFVVTIKSDGTNIVATTHSYFYEALIKQRLCCDGRRWWLMW